MDRSSVIRSKSGLNSLSAMSPFIVISLLRSFSDIRFSVRGLRGHDVGAVLIRLRRLIGSISCQLVGKLIKYLIIDVI